MVYEYKCPSCSYRFEVRQPIWAEHTADCLKCGATAIRLFSRLEWIWANSAFRRDGSRREDKDYAPVMGG